MIQANFRWVRNQGRTPPILSVKVKSLNFNQGYAMPIPSHLGTIFKFTLTVEFDNQFVFESRGNTQLAKAMATLN